jgi:hypothetical protein
MEILYGIQNWIKDNCDGVWEHGEGIQMTTLDKPGREIKIDISRTTIANTTINWIFNEN